MNPNGLQGARLGVTRVGLSGFTNVSTPQPVLDAFEEAVTALQNAGATIVDLDAAGFNFASADGEFLILVFEFRNDVAPYFHTRVGVPVAGGTLQTAIDFNNAHADVEMPFFNQDIWDFAESLAPGPDDPQPAFGGLTYNQALAIDHNAGVNGIDAALAQFQLDAVVTRRIIPPGSPICFTVTTSSSDHPVWRLGRDTRSFRCPRVSPSFAHHRRNQRTARSTAFRWESASSERRSASQH